MCPSRARSPRHLFSPCSPHSPHSAQGSNQTQALSLLVFLRYKHQYLMLWNKTPSMSTQTSIFGWSLVDNIRILSDQEICSCFKQNFLHLVIPSVVWQISVPTSDWLPQSTGTPGTTPQMKGPILRPHPSTPQHHTQLETQILNWPKNQINCYHLSGRVWSTHALFKQFTG